eukprot:gnl/Spiro4/28677_TR14188_c0_g1_i1.p1 gnl/Spiro4/28677_TR14188_c0_g1~~gnl/Spiro4/28677_TR14188_c0_g1_i1.p1  ORF type:complete len:291 (+),score=23.87 gnl/Spiro4/28677_TR14188_c0_g1_i1:1041-1913(+)
MKRLFQNIIVPELLRRRTALGVQERTPSVVVLDCWTVHRSQEFRQWMYDTYGRSIRLIYVPAGCTGQLQPLDVTVNKEFKTLLRAECCEHVAAETSRQLGQGVSTEAVVYDLTLATLRPCFVTWIGRAIASMSHNTALINRAFELTGLSRAWDRAFQMQSMDLDDEVTLLPRTVPRGSAMPLESLGGKVPTPLSKHHRCQSAMTTQHSTSRRTNQQALSRHLQALSCHLQALSRHLARGRSLTIFRAPLEPSHKRRCSRAKVSNAKHQRRLLRHTAGEHHPPRPHIKQPR